MSILSVPKLYSPGPIPQKINLDINFSHRSPEFRNLYMQTIDKLQKHFNIPDKYEILFTQGSGTSAIETVLSCIDGSPCWHSTGTFTERAINISRSYLQRIWRGVYHYYTQFETAESEYYDSDKDIRSLYPDDVLIVDCVIDRLGHISFRK